MTLSPPAPKPPSDRSAHAITNRKARKASDGGSDRHGDLEHSQKLLAHRSREMTGHYFRARLPECDRGSAAIHVAPKSGADPEHGLSGRPPGIAFCWGPLLHQVLRPSNDRVDAQGAMGAPWHSRQHHQSWSGQHELSRQSERSRWAQSRSRAQQDRHRAGRCGTSGIVFAEPALRL